MAIKGVPPKPFLPAMIPESSPPRVVTIGRNQGLAIGTSTGEPSPKGDGGR
jgi:hypothetical protein